MKNERSFGYGRPRLFPENCEDCKSNGVCAEEVIFCRNNSAQLAKKYLSRSIDLECLASGYPDCMMKANEAARIVADVLISFDIASLLEALRTSSQKEEVTSDNIPQFGDLSVAMYLVPEILARNDPMGYVEFGRKLFDRGEKKEDAYRKYAENHCKIAAQLDLARITKKGNAGAIVSSSVMGKHFISVSSVPSKPTKI